jgi:hypothetical protein
MQLDCPTCGRSFRLQGSGAEKATCPECSTLCQLPPSITEDEPILGEPVEASDAPARRPRSEHRRPRYDRHDDDRADSRRHAYSGDSKQSLVIALVVGGLIVAGLGAVLVYLNVWRDKPGDRVAKADPEPPKAKPPQTRTLDVQNNAPLVPDRAPKKQPDLFRLPKPPTPVRIMPPAVNEATKLELSGKIARIAVGGAGRFLILMLENRKELAVFDVNEARIVRTIPLTTRQIEFTAGMTKLIIYVPSVGKIQRWDLLTGEQDLLKDFDEGESISAFCMGSASAGPLIVSHRIEATVFDIDDFEKMNLPASEDNRFVTSLSGGQMWAGPSGRVFGCIEDNGRRRAIFSFIGGRFHEVRASSVPGWFVVPGPDDAHVFFGGIGALTERMVSASDVVRTNAPGQPNNDPGSLYLPAQHGPFYFHAQTVAPNAKSADSPALGTITVYRFGDKKPVAQLPKTVVCAHPWNEVKGLGIENTMHLIPQAKLLIVIPPNRDALHLYPVDTVDRKMSQ